MCEFEVFLEGELVMKDVVVVTADAGNVVLRDVIGDTKVVEGVVVVEVNVPATRLVLARV